MTTVAATKKNLTIEGMTGDTCVSRVTAALKSVPDVTTDSVKVGFARIGADQAGCTAACSAINAAGFKAREANSSPDHGSKNAIPLAGSPAQPGSTQAPHAPAQPVVAKPAPTTIHNS